ncbi:MAG: tRNA (adenosine(37)-N6)-threonylcarbamoyltransferase complex transferase subunit TsaD [Candidatus Gracilibacteria bacterium]
MIFLGIETSCDETAAAVVRDGCVVLSNVIASQVDLHRQTGGVVPEVAAREHTVHILPVIEKALEEAKISFEQIDAIAVTARPGLIASLLTGTNTASTLARLGGKKLVPINHIEGHIYANFLDRNADEIQFPIVGLTISGGHNELFLMKGHGNIVSLGSTLDDAAGEAFDKVARLLDLPYPGGPEISRLAATGNESCYPLPRALLKEGYDFSFSGLKSAVSRLVQREGVALNKADLAASFEEAVCDILSTKVIVAAQKYGAREVHLAGGVSANTRLRTRVHERLIKKLPNVTLRFPVKLIYCTDNAAMIAGAGYFRDQLDPKRYAPEHSVLASTEVGF